MRQASPGYALRLKNQANLQNMQKSKRAGSKKPVQTLNLNTSNQENMNMSGPSLDSVAIVYSSNNPKLKTQGNLASEYREKKARMDQKLYDSITSNIMATATMPTSKKTKQTSALKESTDPYNDTIDKNSTSKKAVSFSASKREIDSSKGSSSRVAGLSKGSSRAVNSSSYNPTGSQNAASSDFVRSKRTVALRINEGLENEVSDLEQDKLGLIQRLNDALVHLDKLNVEKGALSTDLIERIKYVRDLNKEISKGDNLQEVVDREMRDDLKQQKKLGFKMKEQLKGQDSSKMGIQQRLELANGDYQSGLVECETLKSQLGAFDSRYQSLQEEYEMAFRNLRDAEEELERNHREQREMETRIRELREEIRGTEMDRQRAKDQMLTVQEKYDCAAEEFRREQYERDDMRKKHSKLISAKILSESLHQSYWHNMILHFQEINRSTKTQYRLEKSLSHFKVVMLKNRRRRVKKAFNFWYQKGLKPLQTIRQLELVSDFQQKKDPLVYYLALWHKNYCDKLQERSMKQQALIQAIKVNQRFDYRSLKRSLLIWQEQCKENDQGKLAINKFTKSFERRRQERFFVKWRHYSQNIEFQMRIRGAMKSYAYKRYLATLFSSWKKVITWRKFMHNNLKRRYFKNIKGFYKYHKNLRSCATAALIHRKELTRQNVVMAFGALRRAKEEGKLERSMLTLENGEKVKALEAQDAIKRNEAIQKFRDKRLACDIVNRQFGKRLFAYFKKWQDSTQSYDSKFRKDFSIKIIKVYQSKLREAIQKWIQFTGEGRVKDQVSEIQFKKEEQSQIQISIQQEKLNLHEQKGINQCKASRQLKKHIENTYKRHLKIKFEQYKRQCKLFESNEQKMKRLIRHAQRRNLRQGFDKFSKKFNEINRSQDLEQKVQEMRDKKTIEIREQSFRAIMRFALTTMEQRKFLNRCMTKLDLGKKTISFKHWQRYQFYKDNKLHSKEQNKVVSYLKDEKDHTSSLIEKVEEQKASNNKRKKILNHNAQKVFQKYFLACHGKSQSYFFKKWAFLVLMEKQRRDKLRWAACKVVHLALHNSFRKWRTFSGRKQHHIQMQYIEQHTQAIQKTQQVHFHQKEEQSRLQKDSTHNLTVVQRQKQHQKDKNQKIISNIISKKNEMDHIDKRRYVLLGWHSYVQQRKETINLLNESLRKIFLAQGMAAIKEESYDIKIQRRLIKACSMIEHKGSLFQIRKALDKWRDKAFTEVNQKYLKDSLELQTIEQKHESTMQIVEQRVIEQVDQHRGHLVLSNTFNAIREHLEDEKSKRTTQIYLRERLCEREIKRSLHLWHCRAKKAKQLRALQQRGLLKVGQIETKEVFLAWKQRSQAKKHLAKHLLAFTQKIYHKQLQQSYEEIVFSSKLRHSQAFRRTRKGVAKLAVFLSDKLKQNQLSAFMQTKFISNLNKKQVLNIRSIIIHHTMNKFRDFFLRWKTESERKQVLEFNETEGPMRMQVRELEQDQYNLKLLLESEGFPAERIEQIVKKAQSDRGHKIEKTISRMICYNQELYLLPHCLDRWRQWMKHRKLMKYHLKYLEMRISPKRPLLEAFHKWRQIDHMHKNELSKLDRKKLEHKCCNNMSSAASLAQNLDNQERYLEDLTDQRDLLVKSFISSQKLALAVVNQNSQKAKIKATLRLLTNAQRGGIVDYEEALKRNLDSIDVLKDKIRALEQDNVQIGDQNEDLRQGALDGIEMAKTVEELQVDKEKLSIDLSEKSRVIKQLLQENQNLSLRLQNAQEDAQKLIMTSQQKLRASGYSPDRQSHISPYRSPYK